MRPAKGAGPKPSNSIILVPRSNIFFLFYKFDYLRPITTLDINLQSCDNFQLKPISRDLSGSISTEELRNNRHNGWCKIEHR